MRSLSFFQKRATDTAQWRDHVIRRNRLGRSLAPVVRAASIASTWALLDDPIPFRILRDLTIVYGQIEQLPTIFFPTDFNA